MRRSAAVLGCLVAVAVGVVAGFAPASGPGSLVAAVPAGPATALVGVVLLLAAGTTPLVG